MLDVVMQWKGGTDIYAPCSHHCWSQYWRVRINVWQFWHRCKTMCGTILGKGSHPSSLLKAPTTAFILQNLLRHYELLNCFHLGKGPCIRLLQVEWIRGMWADCANVDSPVSLGLFEGENKSIYFQKSLPQLCMWMEMTRKTLEVKRLWILVIKSSCFQIPHFQGIWSLTRLAASGLQGK